MLQGQKLYILILYTVTDLWGLLSDRFKKNKQVRLGGWHHLVCGGPTTQSPGNSHTCLGLPFGPIKAAYTVRKLILQVQCHKNVTSSLGLSMHRKLHWRRFGVTSYGALGHVPLLNFQLFNFFFWSLNSEPHKL